MADGYVITLFFPTGDPRALRVVERMNTVVEILNFQRTNLRNCQERLKRAGAYLLIGRPEEDGELPPLYIGEGDWVGARLSTNYSDARPGGDKAYWDDTYVMMSKDNSLSKAHFEYIESKLIERARAANRCDVKNKQDAQHPTLADAERCRAQEYLSYCLDCLRACGLEFFDTPAVRPILADATEGVAVPPTDRPNLSEGVPSSPQAGDTSACVNTSQPIVVKMEANDVQASGWFDPTNERLVVRKGSQACAGEARTCPPASRNLRSALRALGVLADHDGALEFLQDYEFRSPSAAASVVSGASVSGWDYWTAEDGRTLNAIYYPP